jgi:HK97 family phage major capsid protein
MNDTTLGVLENITDATLGRPLLLPMAESIANGIPSSRLLGYPVVIDQAVPNLSNNVNGIAFGAIREAFVVRDVRDVQILVNPYAATGYVVYDGWARMDSVIQDNYAYACMEGAS